MRKIRTRSAAALLAASLATGLVAAPAVAQDAPPTDSEQVEDAWEEARLAVLQGVKDHAQAAVDHRLASLSEMRGWLSENEHVTSAHASQLRGEFASTESGLVALNEQIQATETVEEALRLTALIASDYRVYVVMVPKTVGVVIGDTVVAIAAEIERGGAEVQGVIDVLEAHGFDTGEMQAALDASMASADQAAVEAGRAASGVIGLTASDWPSPAQATLGAAKRDLDASGASIRASVANLKGAIELIHEALRDHK